MDGARGIRGVLIAVIGLYLVAETALTPFLPQLFERLYGIRDPGATGLYLWVCRIVGLAALPLWGLAARRWAPHRLVLTGLCAASVCDLLLGLAPDYAWFTGLSAACVATNAALLLAYPALIGEYTRRAEEGTDPDHARLAGICAIVVMFHVASVAATLVGAGVLALPQPRLGISAFALLDVALAVLVHRMLRRLPLRPAPVARADSPEPPPSSARGAGAGPVARLRRAVRRSSAGAPSPGGRKRWRGRAVLLAQAALIGVAFDFAVTVSRPFFTELALDLGSGEAGAAVLFFLPSVAALLVLPFARRCQDRLGPRLLPTALGVAAAGFLWQWAAGDVVSMAGGRILFGAALGLGQVAVELRAFRATGTEGPAFTAVETVRSAGLIAAPLAAAAAVSAEPALPLAVAAGALLVAALVSVAPSPA
ncbi:MFS transporter, partial [Streptomyces sp. YIM 98790]|uniref:MFS transporter n=1 Tax=Streptomyces sp. YIM 98790 TaxID=2689077 RepID=UPI00140C90D1